jgi:hypothetical protein
MKTGTIVAGVAAGLVAIMGSAGAADAKGKHVVVKVGHGHGHHHHHHRHHFHGRHFYYGSPVVYGGCGYEKNMWWKTGSFYWKKRYYECKGWW